jgi:hypothetical protein
MLCAKNISIAEMYIENDQLPTTKIDTDIIAIQMYKNDDTKRIKESISSLYEKEQYLSQFKEYDKDLELGLVYKKDINIEEKEKGDFFSLLKINSNNKYFYLLNIKTTDGCTDKAIKINYGYHCSELYNEIEKLKEVIAKIEENIIIVGQINRKYYIKQFEAKDIIDYLNYKSRDSLIELFKDNDTYKNNNTLLDSLNNKYSNNLIIATHNIMGKHNSYESPYIFNTFLVDKKLSNDIKSVEQIVLDKNYVTRISIDDIHFTNIQKVNNSSVEKNNIVARVENSDINSSVEKSDVVAKAENSDINNPIEKNNPQKEKGTILNTIGTLIGYEEGENNEK